MPMGASWGLGMAALLAWRNLTHDRSRFMVTMVGIVFAVVLIAMQAGLFLGFTDTTTTILRHSRADLWILAKGTQNFEITQPVQERELQLVLAEPGVAHAERLMVQFLPWKKPGGGDESVIVVGADLNSGLVGPWNIVAGDPTDLRLPDAAMVDTLYLDKLGLRQGLGDCAEIKGRRVRIVGLTQGIRSFTTSPWIFTSFRTAQHWSGFPEAQSNYIVATVEPGVAPAAVRDALSRRMPRTDVYTTDQLARQTSDYWMFTTGAGASVLVSALLGLLVGSVIVAQVLYATTVDHLAEFGTLRAMGAPSRFIYTVIVGQAVISALLGHLPGVAVALLVAKASEAGAAIILVPGWLAGALLIITLFMCVTASMVSIRKAMTIDPAMVFQR